MVEAERELLVAVIVQPVEEPPLAMVPFAEAGTKRIASRPAAESNPVASKVAKPRRCRKAWVDAAPLERCHSVISGLAT
jgi:hypothetical protein